MTITADGGWFTALLLIALLAVGVMAYRKRWPSRKPLLEAVGGTAKDAKPAKEPEKHSGHGPKKSVPLGKIALYAVIAAAAVLIVVNIIPITAWIVDTFLHDVLGDRIVQSSTVATRQHVSVTTRYTDELPCPPWDRERHSCTLSGTTDIVQAAGLPAGLYFCLTPDPDPAKTDPRNRTWKSIRAILDNGERVDLDPAHPLTNLAGYELTPMHHLPVTYWFSSSPSCT